MDSTVLVRMQLEALSRCVDEVYRMAPGTAYAAGAEEVRDARVDIDLAGGRLLVVYQERGPTGEVAMERDDTVAALEALQDPAVLDPPKPPRRGEGTPEYPHRPKPFMRSLASLFTRKLRQLRREFDGAMEEKIVEQYFGGKEGSVLRGVVTAVGGERRKDAIVQLMPGFVRAGLPEALQCPNDDPQVGQVRRHPLPALE